MQLGSFLVEICEAGDNRDRLPTTPYLTSIGRLHANRRDVEPTGRRILEGVLLPEDSLVERELCGMRMVLCRVAESGLCQRSHWSARRSFSRQQHIFPISTTRTTIGINDPCPCVTSSEKTYTAGRYTDLCHYGRRSTTERERQLRQNEAGNTDTSR